MLRKDLQKNWWAVGLALLFPVAAVIIAVFGIRWVGHSTSDLVYGLFLGNLFCVLPLITFRMGAALFRSENWPLVWTFPVSRLSIFGRKLLAGFLLISVSFALTLALFSVCQVNMDGSAVHWLTFALVMGITFFLGVWLGLASENLPLSLALLALSVGGAYLLLHIAGLRAFVAGSFWVLGPGVLLILGALFLCCLAAASATLFLRHRLFSPWPNAFAAVGLLVAALFTTVALTAGVTARAFRVDGSRRFTPYLVKAAGPRDLLVLGANRMMEPETLWGLGASFDEVPAALVVGADGLPVRTLSAEGTVWCAEASEDGAFVAAYDHDPVRGHSVRLLRVSDQHEVLRLPAPVGLPRFLWRPGAHELLMLEPNGLKSIDADRAVVRDLPLPPKPVDGFSGHTLHLSEGATLFYARFFDYDCLEVYTAQSATGPWTLGLTLGARVPRSHPRMFSNTPNPFQSSKNPVVFFRDEVVHLALVNGQLAAYEEKPLSPAEQQASGNGAGSAFVKISREGVLATDAGRQAIRLLPWNTDAARWAQTLPFKVSDGFAWGDQAFLLGLAPSPKVGATEEAVFARMDLRSGQFQELSRAPATQGHASLLDNTGPQGIVKCWKGERWDFYRVNLASGKVERLLGETFRH